MVYEFEIPLGALQRNIALEVKFVGGELGASAARVQHLCDAMRANGQTRTLDLRAAGLSDGALQQLVAVLATGAMPALTRLDLRENGALGVVADTLMHGLRRLRPTIHIVTAGADGGEGELAAETDTPPPSVQTGAGYVPPSLGAPGGVWVASGRCAPASAAPSLGLVAPTRRALLAALAAPALANIFQIIASEPAGESMKILTLTIQTEDFEKVTRSLSI
ncbi:hypothetical protein T492DRAFT_894674 [Pavlovales sp. CCMP2436]|nr:hypothetical protein T492DRAFT_894674 [Pavlovales sp. CCMP2436]